MYSRVSGWRYRNQYDDDDHVRRPRKSSALEQVNIAGAVQGHILRFPAGGQGEKFRRYPLPAFPRFYQGNRRGGGDRCGYSSADAIAESGGDRLQGRYEAQGGNDSDGGQRRCGPALELVDTTDDLVYFIGEVIAEAEDVLARTPEMLPVIKQAALWTPAARVWWKS